VYVGRTRLGGNGGRFHCAGMTAPGAAQTARRRALPYGTTIADLAIVKDKTEQLDTSVQADWLVKDAGEKGYGLEKLAVDAVALGAARWTASSSRATGRRSSRARQAKPQRQAG
jgi:hypothetical protein